MKKEAILQGGKLTVRPVPPTETAGDSTKVGTRGTNPRTPRAESVLSEIGGSLAPQAGGFAPPAQAEMFTHLTERQFAFLSWRLGTNSDDEAAESAEVGLLEVMTWRGDPEFEAVYQRALTNKRDAFRALGTHLLPKALRVINQMLESSSVRANTTGLQLLLKTQALLDVPQADASAQALKLIEMLRTPGVVVPNTMAPRD